MRYFTARTKSISDDVGPAPETAHIFEEDSAQVRPPLRIAAGVDAKFGA
jgi:hypothetical protein